jgi:hypothetical protein
MTVPRGLLLVALGFAALALPAAASPPASTSFNIVGYEYAFTSSVGSFAGNGSGNAGGTGYWNATVRHDPLGSDPAYVNGGPFAMTVRGPGSSVDAVVGTFSYHGGKITTLDRGANCTNQKVPGDQQTEGCLYSQDVERLRQVRGDADPLPPPVPWPLYRLQGESVRFREIHVLDARGNVAQVRALVGR